MKPTAYAREDMFGHPIDYTASHNFQSNSQPIDPSNNPVAKSKKKRDASRNRKPPEAPKRFKSSYILFFMAKQKEIKAEIGEGASVGEISKRSSEKWKSLSTEERAVWDAKADADKERYKMEKERYTGPWQVPWKRAKKNPNAPKRPMSAFLFFSQDKRRVIKEANPGMRNTEISRVLGEMWKKASAEERAPHIEREAVEREKYKVQMAKWKEEEDVRQREIDQDENTQWLERSAMNKQSHDMTGHQIDRMSPRAYDQHSLSPLPLPLHHHQPHISPPQSYYPPGNPHPDYYSVQGHGVSNPYNSYGSYHHPPPPPPPGQGYYQGYTSMHPPQYHPRHYQDYPQDCGSSQRHDNMENPRHENHSISPAQVPYNSYYPTPVRGYNSDINPIAKSHSDDYSPPS